MDIPETPNHFEHSSTSPVGNDKKKRQRRVILTTGMPRTGTTAVGKMLSLGPGVSTLHEPFNRHVGLTKIDRYFEFASGPSLNCEKLDYCVQQIRDLELRFKPGFFPREKGLRRAVKYVFGGRAKNSYRLCRWNPFIHTIVWKDPFACLVADYLSITHNIEVVVTVRSPWSVAASFKRMGWGFDLTHIIQELSWSFSSDRHPIPDRSNSVANSSILWKIVYSKLLDWSKTNKRIHLVNLDDIIAQPVGTYQKTYAAVNLTWTDGIEKKIAQVYGKKGRQIEPKREKAHYRNRDLKMISAYWKEILSEEEFKTATELNQKLWDALRKACL